MTDEHESRAGSYRYPVNGIEIDFHDRLITGRQALTRSDNVPASEYQLILVRNERTKLIGTDDEIDLHEEKDGELRAFESDRSFGFTVDEVGQVWGAEDMEVKEFVRIWPPRPGRWSWYPCRLCGSGRRTDPSSDDPGGPHRRRRCSSTAGPTPVHLSQDQLLTLSLRGLRASARSDRSEQLSVGLADVKQDPDPEVAEPAEPEADALEGSHRAPVPRRLWSSPRLLRAGPRHRR